MLQEWLGPVVGGAAALGLVVNALRDWRNDDVPWYRLVGTLGVAFAMGVTGMTMRGSIVAPVIIGMIMLPVAFVPTRTAIRLLAPRKALEAMARDGESWAIEDQKSPPRLEEGSGTTPPPTDR